LTPMEFRRHEDCLEISELDPFLAELLRQIPESCNVEGVETAQQRIFSAPAPAAEAESCAACFNRPPKRWRRIWSSSTAAQNLSPIARYASRLKMPKPGSMRCTRPG